MTSPGGNEVVVTLGAVAMVMLNGPAFSELPPVSVAVTVNWTEGAADGDGIPLITPPVLMESPLVGASVDVQVQQGKMPPSVAVKAGAE